MAGQVSELIETNAFLDEPTGWWWLDLVVVGSIGECWVTVVLPFSLILRGTSDLYSAVFSLISWVRRPYLAELGHVDTERTQGLTQLRVWLCSGTRDDETNSRFEHYDYC